MCDQQDRRDEGKAGERAIRLPVVVDNRIALLCGTLEALSGKVLVRRSLEVSSTSFITIISIILGVALALLAVMLRWAPSFADCALPFLITSLEIPPAYFLGHVAGWNAWRALILLLGGAGVGSTVRWVPISHFGGDRHAQRMVHRLLLELSSILIAGAFSAATIGGPTALQLTGK